MERTSIVSVVTNLNTQLHGHQHLEETETEHVIGYAHPDVIRPHMGGQVQLSVPDEELEIHRAGHIFGRLIVRILDVNNSLTAAGVFPKQLLHILPLVKAKLVKDSPTVGRVVCLTVIRDVSPFLGKPGNVLDLIGTRQVPG